MPPQLQRATDLPHRTQPAERARVPLHRALQRCAFVEAALEQTFASVAADFAKHIECIKRAQVLLLCAEQCQREADERSFDYDDGELSRPDILCRCALFMSECSCSAVLSAAFVLQVVQL